MKKVSAIFIVIIVVFILVACGDSASHEGEAKTPSGSSVQKGRNYDDVYNNFQDKGFTNIVLNPMGDLITGWINKEGEVDSVSVAGDEGYLSDKWYKNDVEVVINYHSFPLSSNEEQVEGSITNTVENTEFQDESIVADDGQSDDFEKNIENYDIFCSRSTSSYSWTSYYFDFDTNTELTFGSRASRRTNEHTYGGLTYKKIEGNFEDGWRDDSYYYVYNEKTEKVIMYAIATDKMVDNLNNVSKETAILKYEKLMEQ